MSTSSLTMQDNVDDNDDRIQHEFRSIFNVLIHFSFSLTQLISILTVLALQIALTVTQTCAYRIGIGFWTLPFLLISPISIWFVLWRRSSASCFIAILIHFCSTLFTTAIIIVSFLVLIGQIGSACSTSTWNSYYIILNSSLIGMAGLLKAFHYGEIVLLYTLLRGHDYASTVFIEEFHEKNQPFIADIPNANVWRSWSAVNSDIYTDSDIFFA